MKRLAIALATIAGIGFTAPAFASAPATGSESVQATTGERVQMAQVEFRVGKPRRRVERRVIVRDRDREFRHGRAFRDRDFDRRSKTTIIKRRGEGTVVKKVIRR